MPKHLHNCTNTIGNSRMNHLILFSIFFILILSGCGARYQEKEVADMFHAIKNHLDTSSGDKTNTKKLTMTGKIQEQIKSKSQSVHTYPEASEFKDWDTDGNKYLKEWVGDFDKTRWAQISVENIFSNGPAVAEEHKKTNAIIFAYYSNGVPFVFGGEGSNYDDAYFIFYAPLTTKAGEAIGIDKSGYHLSTYRDGDQNGALNAFIGSKIVDGTLVVLSGADEEIPELKYTTMK